MSIAIIGARGNMGTRYSKICSYLGVPWLGFDQDDLNDVWNYRDVIKSLLIATPTPTHLGLIKDLSRMERPMLIEKPIVTTEKDLETLLDLNAPIKMVNQYHFILDELEIDPEADGECHYDYWNSGKDGLWDFINIIGLSNRPPTIRNTSPIWKCSINGQALNIRDMDHAYCDMIWDWWKNPKPDPVYIEKAHRKVLEGFYVR